MKPKFIAVQENNFWNYELYIHKSKAKEAYEWFVQKGLQSYKVCEKTGKWTNGYEEYKDRDVCRLYFADIKQEWIDKLSKKFGLKKIYDN